MDSGDLDPEIEYLNPTSVVLMFVILEILGGGSFIVREEVRP